MNKLIQNNVVGYELTKIELFHLNLKFGFGNICSTCNKEIASIYVPVLHDMMCKEHFNEFSLSGICSSDLSYQTERCADFEYILNQAMHGN